jgi:hypothetical protein
MRKPDYNKLPGHMAESARLYIEEGVPFGHFLTAVFANDFLGAFNRADEINADAMSAWASFIFNDAPAGCHGCYFAVNQWIKDGGLVGRAAAIREASKRISSGAL